MEEKYNFITGIACTVFWGTSFVFMKVLVQYLSPIEVAFYRYFITGLFFLGWMLISGKKPKIHKEDLGGIALMSILGISLYSYLFGYSIKWVSASEAGILNGTIPMITLLVEVFFLKKKIVLRQIFALLLSIYGIILISTADKENIGGSLFGYAIMLIALVLWVGYSYIAKSYFNKYTEVEINCYQSLIGSFVFIPFILYHISFEHIQTLINPSVIINLLLLSIGSTSFGYLFYLKGLKTLGISTMSFMMNLLPVVAIISGFFILNEAITLVKLTGLTFILISVYLVSIKQNKKVVTE